MHVDSLTPADAFYPRYLHVILEATMTPVVSLFQGAPALARAGVPSATVELPFGTRWAPRGESSSQWKPPIGWSTRATVDRSCSIGKYVI